MFQQKSVTKYNFLKGTECCASLLPKVLSFQQSCSRDLHSWQSCGEETDLSSFRTWGEGDETLTTCKHLSAQTAHREHKCRPVCRAGRTACSSPQSYYWVQVWGHSETRPGVGPLLNSSLTSVSEFSWVTATWLTTLLIQPSPIWLSAWGVTSLSLLGESPSCFLFSCISISSYWTKLNPELYSTFILVLSVRLHFMPHTY